MARFQVTFDCADPDRLAGFWAEALGYQLQPPPEGYASWQEWLEAFGIEDQNQASAIVDPEGMLPRIYFQRVPEGKSAKNRVHLDLNLVGGRNRSAAERRPLVDTQVARLVALGASKVNDFDDEHECWTVMRDPEGNEFCVQ